MTTGWRLSSSTSSMGCDCFGTAPVIEATFNLNSVHYEVFETFIADNSPRPFHDKMTDAFFAHGDALVDARRGLLRRDASGHRRGSLTLGCHLHVVFVEEGPHLLVRSASQRK